MISKYNQRATKLVALFLVIYLVNDYFGNNLCFSCISVIFVVSLQQN
jgi:hypothetical protein